MGEGTIFGIIAVFFGLLSIGYAAYSYLLAARAQSWPRTEGTITHSSAEHWGAVEYGTSSASEQHYLPVIKYTYTARGRHYSRDRIWIGEIQPMAVDGVHEFLRPYQVGTTVPVFFDPYAPAYSVLDTRTDDRSTSLYAWVGIALLAVVVYARFFWGSGYS